MTPRSHVVQHQSEDLVGDEEGRAGRTQDEELMIGLDRIVVRLQLPEHAHHDRAVRQWLTVRLRDRPLDRFEGQGLQADQQGD